MVKKKIFFCRSPHKKYLVVNDARYVLLPEEDTYVNFQNFKSIVKALFINSVYSKYNLKLLTDNSNNGPFTKEYHNYIVFSYGQKSIFVDKKYSKSYKTLCGKDVIDKVINNLLNNSEYCCRVIEKEFDTPLFITKKFIKDLQKKKH